MFDLKFSFVPHVDYIIMKASCILGFLIRNCCELIEIHTIKILLYSFIRSDLEYASLICTPIYKVHKDKLENLQKNFLKDLCYKVDEQYTPRGIPQKELINKFFITNLQSRYKPHLLYFLYKVLLEK